MLLNTSLSLSFVVVVAVVVAVAVDVVVVDFGRHLKLSRNDNFLARASDCLPIFIDFSFH